MNESGKRNRNVIQTLVQPTVLTRTTRVINFKPPVSGGLFKRITESLVDTSPDAA